MHWALSVCLLLMSGRRPPYGEARPQEIAVATSPPSVTDDTPDAAASPAASTTSVRSPGSATQAADPTFLYPKNGLTINSIDELRIQYDTPWDGLTLTVTCKGDGVGGTKSFDVTLDKASGTYTLSKIDSEITVSEYPIDCSLLLQDPDGVANFLVGPEFSIESTRGVASVYALSTTQALSGAAAATGSGSGPSATSGAGDSASTSATNAAASDGSGPSSTAVAGASESSSSDSSDSDGGLSGGAKAGIAFGVILGVALLAFGIFFFLRTRRRMEAMENELQETKKQHANERAYVDGILKVAGKPDTRNGGRVVMAETPNRGSGEWKKFFNSRAASSAAGTAPPSRLGTAVQTAASPVPPSVTEGMSTAGGDAVSVHGSEVGLVNK